MPVRKKVKGITLPLAKQRANNVIARNIVNYRSSFYDYNYNFRFSPKRQQQLTGKKISHVFGSEVCPDQVTMINLDLVCLCFNPICHDDLNFLEQELRK